MQDENERAIKRLERLRTLLMATAVILVIAIILLALIDF